MLPKSYRENLEPYDSSSSDSASEHKIPKDKFKERREERKEEKKLRQIQRQERRKEKKQERKDKHNLSQGPESLFPVLSRVLRHTLIPPEPVAAPDFRHHLQGPGMYHSGGGVPAHDHQPLEHGLQIPGVVGQIPIVGPPPPMSGYRLPLTTSGAFPTHVLQTGPPPFYDIDGVPIYIGSALLEKSVQPCKVGPDLKPFALVPYHGKEYKHKGRFDLLPFKPEVMEWVRTSGGKIPCGRRPIEGGYEGHDQKLYHAAAIVNGVMVPGKTGEHLGGAMVTFRGVEHRINKDYEILCWR